ncbi:MAG: hypothetical protein R3E98_04785 [Gemmatimonadota bacterium]
MSTRAPRRWAEAALACLLGAGATAPLGAQSSAGALAQACAAGAPAAVEACRAAAAGALGLGLGSALLSSGGSLAPVPPNTLGRRLAEGGPRVALSARLLGARVETLGPGPEQPHEQWGWGLRTGLSAGLFDGFRPVPSVGGVLSVDGFAHLDRLALGSDAVAEGAWGYGGGLRIGLLRESFTAPGVSVDLAWQRAGRLDLGTGAAPIATVEASTRSARVSVGKDLFGLGLVAGAGRDWTRLDLDVDAPGGAPVSGTVEPARDVLFVGASLNFLVVQVAGEAGWMGGASDPGLAGAPLDPGSDRLFGGLTVRLVF